MGGPWRDRKFDPHTWRPPAPRAAGGSDLVASGHGYDFLTGVVIGYLAAVVTSVAVVLAFLKYGW